MTGKPAGSSDPEEQQAGKGAAAKYIQDKWRDKKKSKARGSAITQRPEDLRDFIEMETGRLERNIDSVSRNFDSLKSTFKDDLEQVNEAMGERITEVMTALEVQTANKKDIEAIATQASERHRAMTKIVSDALKKPIDVLEDKMKRLDGHMTKVDKHIVQMDQNMNAVMKALAEIQASVKGHGGDEGGGLAGSMRKLL